MYFLIKVGIFHCYVSLPEGLQELMISVILPILYKLFIKTTIDPLFSDTLSFGYSISDE